MVKYNSKRIRGSGGSGSRGSDRGRGKGGDKVQELSRVFAALSDPTRRAILKRLISGDESVGDLAKPYKISLPAISKHLRVLSQAGLLTQTKSGRMRLCSIQKSPLQDAVRWLSRLEK
ncbi:MAG: helix-turn-helix transcriptional regulator [Planctomycetes bacterium]|nr:helix-turn-helix transcriptional regulator [Planctomycetota bacterium]